MTHAEAYAMPEGLSAEGVRAYETITAFLRERFDGDLPETGGCKTFYSPKEWAERGEEYGRSSVLIVVYEGSDVAPFFSLDACYEQARPGKSNCYARQEAMADKLGAIGLYSEECTTWYCAVYPAR